MRFLVFLIGFALAIVILRYRAAIYQFTGQIGFAEKYLGSTVNLIILVGVLCFVGGLMYWLGTLQSILDNTIGGFF